MAREKFNRSPASSVTFRFLLTRMLQLWVPSGTALASFRVLSPTLPLDSTGLFSAPAGLVIYVVLLSIHVFVFVTWLANGRRCCRVCGRTAGQPIMVGTWASVWLDAPQTEYLCPEGHGRLVETQAAFAAGWTWFRFDESWADVR